MKYLRLCSQVVLLTTTVTFSQVFAEEPPKPTINPTYHDGDNSFVGQGILEVLPKTSAAVKAGFPSDPGRPGVKVSSPGRTYGTLTAILVAAGGAAAFSLLLTRGGNKPSTPVV